MKPAPKSPEFDRFTSTLRHIVSIPKSDIVDRGQKQKEARKIKRASGRVSRDKD